MKREIVCLGIAWVAGCLFAMAFADVKISVDYNGNAVANRDFKFKSVPSPARDDEASKAKVTLVDGEIDGNSADLGVLTDGLLPTDEDQPAANFFFNAGTGSGRFRLDLGAPTEIAQINTYSWHPNTRGPQVYKVYAADGSDPKFNPAPAVTLDPSNCGWKLIAQVDTRPRQGEGGGQYGVSLSDSGGGSLGKFRYLLFHCIATEIDDDYGNTFFSEVDVLSKK
jgi:hypothetical protein